MLQNVKVTAFTISDILKENQQRGKITPLHPLCHNQTGVNSSPPFPPAHKDLEFGLQVCTWDDYLEFLIAELLITQWDLPTWWITIWMVDDGMIFSICLVEI